MTEAELDDAIDGFHAWDAGCRDSGISDPILRRRVQADLHAMSLHERLVVLHRMLRTTYPASKGYDSEDWRDFGDWWKGFAIPPSQ